MRVMRLPDHLVFASDATIAALAGLSLLAISLLAAWGDKRRKNRTNVDAVGLLPWRDIGALSGFAGLALLVMALVSWLGG